MGEAKRKQQAAQAAVAADAPITLNQKTVLALHEAYCRYLALAEAAEAARLAWARQLAARVETLGLDVPLERLDVSFLEQQITVKPAADAQATAGESGDTNQGGEPSESGESGESGGTTEADGAAGA